MITISEQYIQTYGHEQLERARKCYQTHKRNAHRRNIAFQFTQDEWLSFWYNDWLNRGNLSHQMVMSRYNDTGPYNPANCFIQSHRDNLVTGHKQIQNRGAGNRGRQGLQNKKTKHYFIRIALDGQEQRYLAHELSISGYRSSLIYQVVAGRRNHHQGYKWRLETI